MDCNLLGSSVPGDSPGKNTREGCHALLEGMFPIQESDLGFPRCRQILYQLSYQGSPRMVLEKENFKDEFSESVLGLLNWLSNLIRCKDTNDYF